MALYAATVHVLIEADNEPNACDLLSAVLDDGCIRDWVYIGTSGGTLLSPRITKFVTEEYVEGDLLEDSVVAWTPSEPHRIMPPCTYADCPQCSMKIRGCPGR